MTDETRERIKSDAIKYCVKFPHEPYDQGKRVGFEIGAVHQHPIAYSQGLAEGRRQAVEEIITKITALILPEFGHVPSFIIRDNKAYKKALKELEKLRYNGNKT